MRRLVLMLMVGGCIWIAHCITSSPGVLSAYASYCAYPIIIVQRTLMEPVHHFFARRKTQQELDAIIDALVQEKEALLAELITLRATTSYLYEISEAVDFKARYGYQQAKLAHVLVRHISEQEHFFLVSLGSEHGIEKDMIAVYKNSLVGRVVAVYPWYSKLLLITDRTCKIAAQCSMTDAVGIHEGINVAHESNLTRVSHLANVAPGDFILSTGDGLIFPKGFALGTIASAEIDGLFYKIKVTPIFDVTALDHCYLMRKNGV